MEVYLTDTNILIGCIRGRQDRVSLLRQLLTTGGMLSCSVITVGELYSGMRSHEQPRTDELLAGMLQFDATSEIARLAGRFKNTWATQGRTFSLDDMIIAATAMVHGLTLVTS